MKISKLSYYSIFASICGILNIITYDNFLNALVLTTVEIFVLLYLFFKNKITDFICFYLIFLSLSMEFSGLIRGGIIYSFKEFRLLGVNLAIWALVPVTFQFIFRYKFSDGQLKNSYLVWFLKYFLLICIIGIIMGTLLIIINDNNVRTISNLTALFAKEIYIRAVYPFMLIAAYLYIQKYEQSQLNKLNSAILAILLGVVVELIVSLALNETGIYGDIATLVSSSLIRFIPFMLYVPFCYKKVPKYYCFFSIMGLILSISYNATGKQIILYAISPLVILLILIQRKSPKAIICMMIVPIFFIAVIGIVPNILNTNALFIAKYKQVVRMFSWGDGWYKNLPPSPRVRVAEIINILNEYTQKPWYLPLGKGYMGTTPDYLGEYNVKDAFADSQVKAGIFYSVHENFSQTLLFSGLLGLGLYLSLLILIIKHIGSSPFLLIGGYWFLMGYGFSASMSAFGMFALLIGLTYIDYDIHKINLKQYNNARSLI